MKLKCFLGMHDYKVFQDQAIEIVSKKNCGALTLKKRWDVLKCKRCGFEDAPKVRSFHSDTTYLQS